LTKLIECLKFKISKTKTTGGDDATASGLTAEEQEQLIPLLKKLGRAAQASMPE